jgi:putative transposase
MPDYRRARVPGASYFFTVVTHRRRPLFVEPANVQLLRTAFRKTLQQHPFRIDAMVVLPDHLHAIWTLPAGDDGFPHRWRLIKSHFSRCLQLPATRHPIRDHERNLWQRCFWEHRLRDDDDFRRHVDYIHYNPVKHGLTQTPAEWPYSSFRRAVSRGDYPADWGKHEPDIVKGMECE